MLNHDSEAVKVFRLGRQDPQIPPICIPFLCTFESLNPGPFRTWRGSGSVRVQKEPLLPLLLLPKTHAALAAQGSRLVSSERDP